MAARDKATPIGKINKANCSILIEPRGELKRGEELLPIGTCVLYNPDCNISTMVNNSPVNYSDFVHMVEEPSAAILYNREWLGISWGNREIKYRLLDCWLFSNSELGLNKSTFVEDGKEKYELISKGTLGGDTMDYWYQVLERQIGLRFSISEMFSSTTMKRGSLNSYLPKSPGGGTVPNTITEINDYQNRKDERSD